MTTTIRVGPAKPQTVKQSGLQKWFLGTQPQEVDGPYETAHHTHPWWKVMCLTGVDYFSTLGYQPGIAALAAGLLSPLATLILVLITLFGALPMYKRVADESPHGDGSISMLERLLPWWQGKLLVLALLGFVATGFVITITLSAADATAHIVENPYGKGMVGTEVWITLGLILLLGAVFLKGFSEAIGIAVAIVVIYLGLNVVVLATTLRVIAQDPSYLSNWQNLLRIDFTSPTAMIIAALIVFPKLALGLSGFETGVVVMPLVKGSPDDDPAHPVGRIRNTRKLLTSAAGIMSVLLIASSMATTLLIPHAEFEEGGEASGRALAYLAHEYLGEVFGTIYDISTIAILWFAGASAMAGLLNIVPRYLPRYGMAPTWSRATRPLVVIFTIICAVVTIIFKADVNAQAGAYATGVLALITSATIAVTLSARRKHETTAAIWYGIVSLIFIYTTAVTIISSPDGLKIAVFFIAAIIILSLVSRVMRSTELRTTAVSFDDDALRFIDQAAVTGPVRIIANHPDERSSREYLLKEKEEREASHIPAGDPVLFLEVTVRDASDFAGMVKVDGEQIGTFRVLKVEASSVPNAIAAVLLAIRERTGKRPHAYFGWTEGNPLTFLARFVLFGEGDIAPVTREVLRQSEPDPGQRPAVHIG